MRLLNYDFVRHELNAARNADGSLATYVHDNPEGRPLNPNAAGPFVRIVLSDRLPSEPGVYAVTVDDSVVYLGRSRTPLRDRWGPRGYAVIHRRNTYNDGQSTNCRINHHIGQALASGAQVALWTYVTDQPVQVEVELERALRPTWNVQRL